MCTRTTAHPLPKQQAGGALGSGTWNFASSLSEDEVRIVGTRGRLTFSVFDNGALRLVTRVDGGGAAGEDPEEEKEEEEEVVVGPFDGPAHVHQPLVAAAVRDVQAFLKGGRRWTREDEAAAHCRSMGASALRASEAMDAALGEYYGGSRDDAFWARPETWASGNRGGGGGGGEGKS
jgi:hypothetical protein